MSNNVVINLLVYIKYFRMTKDQIIKQTKRGDYWKNQYKVLRDYNIYEAKKHIKGTKNIYYVYVCGVN
jgi:hypothetical protein